MNRTIKMLALIFAAVAASPAAAVAAKAPGDEIPFVNSGGIRDWTANDDSTLYVKSAPGPVVPGGPGLSLHRPAVRAARRHRHRRVRHARQLFEHHRRRPALSGRFGEPDRFAPSARLDGPRRQGERIDHVEPPRI